MKKDKKPAQPGPSAGISPSPGKPVSSAVEKVVDIRDEETQRAGAIDDTLAKPPHPESTPTVASASQSRQSRFPVIAGYLIEEVIGRGGMGVVYRGRI